MAQQLPISVRTRHRQLRWFLEWLQQHDINQADYLREWLETGFSIWLARTAFLDPALYEEIVSKGSLTAVGDAPAATPEQLRLQGIAALRETLEVLLGGIGGVAGGRRSGAGTVTDGVDAGDPGQEQWPDDEGISMFMDVGDSFETL